MEIHVAWLADEPPVCGESPAVLLGQLRWMAVKVMAGTLARCAVLAVLLPPERGAF